MSSSHPPDRRRQQSPAARRIEDWKQRLIDLTRRNRLLYFKPSKSAGLTVTEPDAETVFGRLVVDEKPWTFWMPPADVKAQKESDEENLFPEYIYENDEPEAAETPDPRLRQDELFCGQLSRKKLEQTLKNIYRKAKTDYQERGVRVLYVAFGTLSWTESGASQPSQSPLVLVPVELERETARDPFILTLADEDIVLNPALLVKLRNDFRIELPPISEDWEAQSLGDYLDSVARVVAPLGWSVEPTAHIGLFSFHKLAMFQDLTANAQLIAAHKIIRSLAGEESGDGDGVGDVPDMRELDAIQKPEETFQILDADSSQQQCVQAALRGKSIVLQGPPGTGKSQTIANVIAEFLARGKTVLFVSEKMAALEVVHKRLSDAHLGDFCLELHSHKANKREVVAELNRCLTEMPVPSRLPTPSEFDELKTLRHRLNEYVLALHEERQPLGQSVREVLARLAELEDAPIVPARLEGVEGLGPARVRESEELIKRLAAVWHIAEEGRDFPWYGCAETRFTLETRAAWGELLSRLASAVRALDGAAGEYAAALGLEKPQTFADAGWLARVGTHLNNSPGPDADWLTSPELEELFKQAERYKALCDEYWRRRHALAARYNEPFFDLPEEATARTRQSWQSAAALLQPDGTQGRVLIERGRELLLFLEETPSFTEGCRRDTGELLTRFGLAEGEATPERARELARLATLCQSPERPEGQWLDHARLQRVRALVARIRPEYEEYNRRRTALVTRYDESLFDLDLDRLIESFGGFFYRSFLRFINPAYHRDKKAILRASRSHQLAGTVLEDLLEAREVKRLRRRLDSERGDVPALLGEYDRGYDTDFDAVERALGVAAEALTLLRGAPTPEAIKRALGNNSASQPEVFPAGRRLAESIGRWETHAAQLNALIPSERLPGTELPLGQSTLGALDAWAAQLAGPLRELLATVEAALAHRRGAEPVTLVGLLADLGEKDELRAVQTQVEKESGRLRQAFGRRFRGVGTPWAEVLEALEWTRVMRELFGTRPLPSAFVSVASRGGAESPPAAPLAAGLAEADQSLTALEQRFSEPHPTLRGERVRDLPLDALAVRVSTLRERLDELQFWIDYVRAVRQAEEAGLADFLSELHKALPPGAQLVRALQRSVFQAWADSVMAADPRLGEFRGRDHERVAGEFRALDQRLVRLTSQRVIERCNGRRPQAVFMQARDTEIGVLRREAAKKRRHLPVRHLFDALPNLLQRLKPCLLMSPLSVSQFLRPERIQFDLVIFDEASQIFTEDAVGAIYRGRQLVVAGDSKQLPPTDFFKGVESGDDEAESEAEVNEPSAADFSSVLDECGAVPAMAPLSLRWHYRSRHESLIAFSNHRFYDNKLVTFPSAQNRHPALGVELIHLPDGVYDRGGKRINQREAERVADFVFEHFARHPHKSLGVVAFSQAQMVAIEDEIDRRRLARPEFEQFFKEDRLEGFFVKNLENVQGDERDVIVFSIGYGYDQHRRITMNFGPLNRAGGERRLNVAVTRAREKVVVVSSITASDIKLSEAPPSGVLSLYHYLDYAARGEQTLSVGGALGSGEAESPLEEDVAAEIRRMGYDVIPQVGCSGYRIDIGVVDPAEPGRFLLGVECDGATYHSAATARDRDRLRQQVLEDLGWRIHRIWSPDWVGMRGAEIKKLREAIEGGRREARDGSPAVPPPAEQEAKTEAPPVQRTTVAHPAEAAPLPGTVPYRAHALVRNYYSAGEFHEPQCRGEQCQLLAELVAGEGPIHIKLAARRLAELWGNQQVGVRMMRAVEQAADFCERNGALRRAGDFLWPADLQEVAVRVPAEGAPESFRDVEHIPPEELRAAMILVAGHAVGISSDSLLAETAKLFGVARVSGRIRERLQTRLEELIHGGQLSWADGMVSLNSR